MSYVGAPGGPNDFTVYRYAIGRSSWLGQFVNFRGMGLPITVYPKAVLAITGFGNIGDSPSAVLIDRNLGGDKDLDYAVAFNGQSIVSPQQTIRYEITDFHGSNWQIERHNTLAANEFATSGAYTLASGYEDGSTEINSIGSWDEAWIEGWRGGPGSMLLFPIDPTHVGVGWITTSINPSDLAVYGFYVIRNPEIYVEHYGNPEGPGGWLENETILRETLSDLIPLDGATQITESQDRVVPRVYGVLGHYAGGLPTYLSREFGEHDTAALALTYYYEDGVGIRVEHSAPDGALRYAAQVVQFSRPPEASVESLESVVNRPAFDVQIRKR